VAKHLPIARNIFRPILGTKAEGTIAVSKPGYAISGGELLRSLEEAMSVSRDYVAEYIHDACIELRKMATDARFEVLSQILGMAVLEASDHQRDRQQSCLPEAERSSG
jgi:hypothetical protein